jgi:hypothetical protein
MGAGDTTARGFDLVGAGEGSGNLYIRERSIGTWSRLWHNNNDGSGSGLDADTLDGNQGSYYLPKSVNLFSGTGDDTSAPVRMQQDATFDDYIIKHSSARGFFSKAGHGWHFNGANSCFHVLSSGWVAQFGVDGTGSARARVEFRAPAFVDSDNTAYYLNPLGGFNFAGGTSNRVTYIGNDSGIIVSNAEGAGGNVRIGAAWGYPGLYNSADLNLVAGATTDSIRFRLGSGEYAAINSDYFYHNSDIRAPIFYDSNDTAVRWDNNVLVLRGGSPTIYLRDTDNDSAMIHVNGNTFYVLRGTGDTETWTAVGGVWPLTINLNTNAMAVGGALSAPSLSLTTALPVASGGTGVTTSTGSGNVVLSTSPTLVTPALGTPASGNLANCTFPTLNQNTTGSAGSVTNALTINNGGAGSASGTTYNGSAAVTISHNSIGAVPTSRTIGIVQGTGVTVTTSGSLDLTANRSWTIAIGQDVATTASPTFNNITYTTLTGPATNTRDKIRLWNAAPYSIGMTNGFTFGGLVNEYAMTFQMDNNSARGFWWGDSAHAANTGSMSLTTDGKLTVAHSIRAGYGETDTTVPGATHRLDVSGSGYFTDSVTVAAGNATGTGIILSDDGDIVDLNNGFCNFRFSYGVTVFSGNKSGSPVITLSNAGTGSAAESWRAPIFYDTNNTAFYTDPASGTVLGGDLQFNSGYGSTRLAYGVRVWANYTTTTVNASGGVTSVTLVSGTTYSINFNFTMVDANYSATATVRAAVSTYWSPCVVSQTTTACQIGVSGSAPSIGFIVVR